NLSRCSWVMRGLFANLAQGPPGAASRIPYTTIVVPNRTGLARSARRSTNFIIGGSASARGWWTGTTACTARSGQWVARKVHPRARGAHGRQDAAAGRERGARERAPHCARSGQKPEAYWRNQSSEFHEEPACVPLANTL